MLGMLFEPFNLFYNNFRAPLSNRTVSDNIL